MEFNPPPKDLVCTQCQGEVYQRADDSKESIQVRLDVYGRQTAPLIAYYENKGLIRKIDGNKGPSQVQEAIFLALG
jgi:adenylate kinase